MLLWKAHYQKCTLALYNVKGMQWGQSNLSNFKSLNHSYALKFETDIKSDIML